MVVYMVDAEAVVALTAGAVTEFEVGVGNIRSAAHLAAAVIGLCALLVLDSADFVFEVYGIFALLYLVLGEIREEAAAAEDEIVQNCDNGQKIVGEGESYYTDNKEKCINKCYPFYLNRNNEE